MEAFLVSTATVTLAEIGDKTQLLSLVLAAKFRNKMAIVLGILFATILNHALSAWLGVWAADIFASEWTQLIVSASFILVGLWLLIPDKEEEVSDNYDKYGAFLVSSILFFIAEIGDKTQIATVILGAQYNAIVLVTIGTTLGMLLANVPVVYYGEKLMAKLPLDKTRIAAALLFIVIAVVGLV